MIAAGATREKSTATGRAPPPVSDLVRSSVLMGYQDLVVQLGGNPAALMRAASIPVQALADEESYISFRGVVRLLEASAAALESPDFGLKVAQRQDLRILGPIRIIGMNSETVGDALKSMIAHLAFSSSIVMCQLDTSTDPKRPRLTYDVSISGETHKRLLFELALGLLTRHMHALTDGHFTPVAVTFRHGAHMPLDAYRRFLGVRPQFGAAVDALVVRPADLNRPLQNCDPHLRRVMEDYVRDSTAARPRNLRQQVEYLVRRGLSTGRISLQPVASELFLHERTLQRRLMLSGIAFEEIVDAARRDRFERTPWRAGAIHGRYRGTTGICQAKLFQSRLPPLVWQRAAYRQRYSLRRLALAAYPVDASPHGRPADNATL